MIPLLATLLVSPGLASEPDEAVRIGIFVGNNEGATGQLPLIFATADARKMRDLFVELGDVDEEDALLLEDEGRRDVQNAFIQAKARITAAHTRSQRSELVFFYSGHADEDRLQLGATSVPYEELRTWLEDSGADVRVAMVDACRSGALIRQKGGTRGTSTYEFEVDARTISGTAVITSSAANEYSQESTTLGGGYFTHYLHTALSGAADADRDGEVTLSEAYAFVHAETAFGTREAPEHQTPSYEFDLSGSGELRLTSLEESSAWLLFPGGFDGTYAVWDEDRKRYVAEVDAAQPQRLAVRPGHYYVHRRMPAFVEEAEYTVRRMSGAEVRATDFERVPYERTASRGDLERAVRRASRSRVSLRVGFGGRGWGANTPITTQYLPEHGVFLVGARFLQPSRGGTYWDVDLIGGSGQGTLHLPELGEMKVVSSSLTTGGAVGIASRPRLVRVGGGIRAEVGGFWRSFTDDAWPTQGALTPAVGGQFWIGMQHGRLNAGLDTNLLWAPVGWDGLPGVAAYGEILLTAGFRL